MASPHAPQPPRHSFFASGPPIPFNAGAHGFHQPTPASYTFGGPGKGTYGSPSPASPQHAQQNPFLVAWGGSKQSFGSTPQAGPSTGFGTMSASPSISRMPLASSGQITSPSYVPGFGTSKKRRPEEEEHSGSKRLDEDEEGMEGTRVIVGRKGAKRARGTRTEGGPTTEVDHGDDAGKVGGQDVDVGVLLASLPPTTHLQILLSLLESQPTLKSSILALVPSLDVQFCVDDLQAKARAVVAAVPLGASRGGVMVRSGSGIFGAGRSTFDQGGHGGAMSEGYTLNRLRAPINDFCATAMVYLPFFSPSANNPAHATSIHQFISSITHLIITNLIPSLPSGTTPLPNLSSLITSILESWHSWLQHVSDIVNKQGGMFAASVVEGWFKSVDELSKVEDGTSAMAITLAAGVAEVGNRLVREVGWLIGREVEARGPREAETGRHGGRISPVDQSMDEEL